MGDNGESKVVFLVLTFLFYQLKAYIFSFSITLIATKGFERKRYRKSIINYTIVSLALEDNFAEIKLAKALRVLKDAGVKSVSEN